MLAQMVQSRPQRMQATNGDSQPVSSHPIYNLLTITRPPIYIHVRRANTVIMAFGSFNAIHHSFHADSGINPLTKPILLQTMQ
jgi:hypothetical protein